MSISLGMGAADEASSAAASSDRASRYMREALAEGKNALERGEVPVGCVFVDVAKDEVVARGSNQTNATRNGTSHAELVCIQDLATRCAGDLSSCELFVTCEPCIMCAAALRMLRIKAVYFGCHNDRFGGNGSVLSLHGGPDSYPVHPGILKAEAIELFQDFYTMENRRAPEAKRKRKG